MAKNIYKVPASIKRSRMDMDIVIESQKAGFRLKPLPMKVVLYAMAMIIAWFYIVISSPLLEGASTLMKVVITLWWIWMAVLFGRRTKTGAMSFTQIPALLQYLPKSRRTISTRRTAKPFDFMEFTNIKDIDDNGMIHFLDGSYGQAYSVVGSASRLLFSGDRAMIVDRVDNFFRKVDTGVDYIFLTMKEPQRVYRQLRNFEAQMASMKHATPELRELMQEKYDIAKDDVGGKFNSVHQYVILKSKSLDTLHNAHQLLKAETEGSSVVFSQCTMLNGRATLDMFSTMTKKREIVV